MFDACFSTAPSVTTMRSAIAWLVRTMTPTGHG
jgi:hypothetical protein